MATDYGASDQGSDALGMVGAVTGAGGRGFFDDRESMIKGGLRMGMSLSNGAVSIAKNVGAASSVAGPIGAAVAFTLDTCINFYEASQDLGKAQSKVAALKDLKTKNLASSQETKEILDWLINKIERREMYNQAETGGEHAMAAAAKSSWTSGTHAGRAKAVGIGASMAVAAPLSVVGGQLASKGARAGRGLLKKTGLMGSKRKDYARKLFENSKKADDKLAQAMVKIVLTAGIANKQDAEDMQRKIDGVVQGALEKGMSSFKE